MSRKNLQINPEPKLKSRPPTPKRTIKYGKILYVLFLVPILITAFIMPASAATIWEKANEIRPSI